MLARQCWACKTFFILFSSINLFPLPVSPESGLARPRFSARRLQGHRAVVADRYSHSSGLAAIADRRRPNRRRRHSKDTCGFFCHWGFTRRFVCMTWAGPKSLPCRLNRRTGSASLSSGRTGCGHPAGDLPSLFAELSAHYPSENGPMDPWCSDVGSARGDARPTRASPATRRIRRE